MGADEENKAEIPAFVNNTEPAMRRRDREVFDMSQAVALLDEAPAIVLSLGGVPVPMSYGYSLSADKELCFFIHSAVSGRKVPFLRNGEEIGFSIFVNDGVQDAGRLELLSVSYRSIIGHGRVTEIKDRTEKRDALSNIARREVGQERPLGESAEVGCLVFRLDVSGFRMKANPRK